MKESPQNEEARKLLALAKKGVLSANRENLIAAMGWELCRYAYHHDMLPEFWRKSAEKQRPPTSRKWCSYDEIFRRPDFPGKRWSELPEKERNDLMRLLVGEQSRGARFLEGREAKRRAQEFIHHEGDFQMMEDGGIVVMLRVYPGSGWNKISQDIKKELKQLELSPYGKANANDVARIVELLKGLAALWLKGRSKAEINGLIFKTRAKKGDYAALNKATQNAENELNEMLKMLNEKLKMLDEKHPDSLADNGATLSANIAAFVASGKKRQKTPKQV